LLYPKKEALSTIFDTRIEYLKGVGPQKAELLNKELGIFTYGDLLQHYPFRYEDRSTFLKIKDLHEELEHVQVIARIKSIDLVGMGSKKRLVAFPEFWNNCSRWFTHRCRKPCRRGFWISTD